MKSLFLLFVLFFSLYSCKHTYMKTSIQLDNESVSIDLSMPLDISATIQNAAGVGAWYIDPPKITHVEVDGYVGNVELGGSTNFNNVFFNPHSHGTHTECIGHITKEFHSVHDALDKTFFKAQLITVTPEKRGEDLVITNELIGSIEKGVEAIIIRTLPNEQDRLSRNYSNTNPPYVLEEVALRFRESGINHLLIDLPSVDKEKDNGALLSHKAFWNFHGEQRTKATITELIYVKNSIDDGLYMMDLQIAPIQNDAAPSRPILYKLES
jgi:kynurenine formamidase